ncbi:segregation/condensation protein A, partial [Myxococcota bacterium]
EQQTRLEQERERAVRQRSTQLARHRSAGVGVALKAFAQLATQRQLEAERAHKAASEKAERELQTRARALRDLARRMATEAGVALRAFVQLARQRAEDDARAQREAHRQLRRRVIEVEVAIKAFAQLEVYRALQAEEEARKRGEEEEAARLATAERAERERKRRAWELVQIPRDYAPAPESGHELYQLDLDAFEGPLDLLLFLIRRHQVDVFDIPMAFVCERYVEYIRMMEELSIDVAAEFMYMAAELLHIKSKMLLPRPTDVEEEDDVDPRADLVRRLLEYQKYKDAGQELAGFNWLGRDRFGREPEKIDVDRRELPLREVGVFTLIEAFDAVLQRMKPELRHQVMMEEVSVAERVRRFVHALAGKEPIRFLDLLGPVRSRLDVVVSFLAMLEMTRLRLLRVYQSMEGVLYIKPRFENPEVALHYLEDVDETLYAG